VLVVGAVEPEVVPWLRAAGHTARAVRGVSAALVALEKESADLVIVDREPGGEDTAGVCRGLREASDLFEPWLLAITIPARGRGADAALDAGADDYLHRPFTRGELLARTRAGLRAAQQRHDDQLVRALMVNVPGAIYRSAWHDGHKLELISDEIERISGYPAANFIASSKRTLLSIIHPRDRKRVMRAVAKVSPDRGQTFVLEYRIMRADNEVRWVLDRGQLVRGPGGRLWMDGAIFDITERRAAEEALRRQEIERARTEELRASRIRIVEAADAARRRIERDLHDGAQQRLVALGLDVRVAQRRFEKDPSSACPFLEKRARPRHPSGGADRARARAGDLGAGRPLPRARRRARGAGRAVRLLRGGDGLLHRGRGADQRRQVRAGQPRDRAAGAAQGLTGGRGERRRRRGRPGGQRLRPVRSRRPRRRDRGPPHRHEPARRGHGGEGRRAARAGLTSRRPDCGAALRDELRLGGCGGGCPQRHTGARCAGRV
jgi:PAS domain S-box-containing protein